jgi:hypothetical protein
MYEPVRTSTSIFVPKMDVLVTECDHEGTDCRSLFLGSHKCTRVRTVGSYRLFDPGPAGTSVRRVDAS